MPESTYFTQTATVDDLSRSTQSGFVYAVLDACDAPAVQLKVKELPKERVSCLYDGKAAEEQWDSAPYLTFADPDMVKWLVNTVWQEPWGIFVFFRGGLDALRAHLRHFLMVHAPDGDTWQFRYYDPRILPVFLPTCTQEQLRQFYGPVLAYGVTDLDTGGVQLLREGTQVPAQGRGPVSSGPMFQLQQPNLDAFVPHAREEFARRVARFLRDKKPHAVEGLDDKTLLSRVRAGLARARKYEMARESTLAGFVALMFRFAPNFDEQPNIQKILTDKEIPPDDRIDEVVQLATDEDWADAKRRKDPKAWEMPEEAGAK